MRWIDGLSMPQRVVVVVALGLGLGTVGGYLVSLGGGNAFGWTGYAPLSSAPYALSRGLHGWLRVIIWLVLIGLWAVASVRVLRPSRENAPTGD
jgi:heme/copper-type cytochrome/quinol oxidase subunit 1